jgi:nitrate reductase gamma subunit
VYGSAPTTDALRVLLGLALTQEIHMYIGGGLLGLILVIAIVIFVLRRA